jgi:hypothetical protein
MKAAHQPLWKLDTMFLAVATVALIFSWMAHPGHHREAGDTPAASKIVLSSSTPSARLQP